MLRYTTGSQCCAALGSLHAAWCSSAAVCLHCGQERLHRHMCGSSHLPSPSCPLCLQPVVGDWQQRVKQAKRHQRADAAAAAASAASAATQAKAAAGSAPAAAAARGTKPDLDALSEGLPSGWRAMWDATHSRVYFGNLETQASLLRVGCSPPRCASRPVARRPLTGFEAVPGHTVTVAEAAKHVSLAWFMHLPCKARAHRPVVAAAGHPACLPVHLPNRRPPARYQPACVSPPHRPGMPG